MKINFERVVPPGFDYLVTIKFIVALNVASVLFSFGYLIELQAHYSELFTWENRERFLIDGALMADFHVLLDRYLLGFVVAAFASLALAGYHYAYHYTGSRSINLMKRLPNRWEIHRRCWSLPCAGFLLSAAIGIMVLFIYYGVYKFITPQECLTPDQWQKLWRAWL